MYTSPRLIYRNKVFYFIRLVLENLSFCCHIMYITSSKKKIIKKKLPTCSLRRDEKLLFSFRKRIFPFFFQSKKKKNICITTQRG